MPSPRNQRNPSLRRHRPSQRAVVRLNGKDHYLGPWPNDEEDPSPEVQLAYHQLIAEWLANDRQPLPTPEERKRERLAGRPERVEGSAEAEGGITVAELIVKFLAHADTYYRHPDGKPTGEVDNFKYALRPLNYLYGPKPARRFRARRLKRVRALMVNGYEHPQYGPQAALSRKHLNTRIARIVRAFKWAAEEELIPEVVWRRLATVRPLQRNRSQARETKKVQPVALEHVEPILPHLLPTAAAMVKLQTLAGMRPGEVLRLRLNELDRSRAVWLYRPSQHKTLHLERDRVVAIGPRAQVVILDWLRIQCPICGTEGRPPRIGSRDGCICGPCADRMDERGIRGPWPRCEVQSPEATLFSPRLGMEERYEDMRAKRKSKVQPSQVCRKKAKAKRKPGDHYSTTNYANAIRRACELAGVPPWSPNQLRHLHGTQVRKLFGLEAAQVALGHAKADTTEIYAEKNLELAIEVASKIG